MSGSSAGKSSRERVRAHRQALRAHGLRPLQIWVPNVRASSFKAEAHRQSLAVARSRHAEVDQEFIEAIIADVRTRAKVDPRRILLMGWSSGGPPCYAAALRDQTPVTGAFIAMSVFKPQQVPAIANARGRAFYLLQSPDDRVTPFRFAIEAEKSLNTAGAKVQLQRYNGGHGWQGDVWKMIGDGIQWLEKSVAAVDF